MKNIFLIWLIIFGAGMLCIDLALKLRNIESTSITTEPVSENADKDDTDEGMFQCIQLAFYSSFIPNTNGYTRQPQHGVKMRALKPPRPANIPL